MSSSDECDPSEMLYRRIPTNDIDPETKEPRAIWFRPHKNDSDGLSLFRKALCSPEETITRPGKKYYVVEIPASAFLELDANIVVDKEDPRHVTIQQMTGDSRNETWCLEWQDRLTRSCGVVHGPIGMPDTDDASH